MSYDNQYTDEDLDSIYQALEDRALKTTRAQDAPKVVFVGGQPGAGKSAVAAQAMNDLGGAGQAYKIDVDDMREFHPRYAELNLSGHDRVAAQLTHDDVSAWAQRLAQKLIEERRNVVVDGTLGSPATAEHRLRMFKEAGYQIEVRALSVPEQVSSAGVYKRYEDSKERLGYGRWLSEPVHKQAYEGLPKSLDAIERAGLSDRVAIYRRDAALVYDNRQKNGAWERPPEAGAALARDRARDLTLDEKSALLADWAKVRELALSRMAEHNHVATIITHQRAAQAAYGAEVARAKADDFRTLQPEEAVKKHPDLVHAYAAVHVAGLQGRNEQEAAALRTVAVDSLARRIEGGDPIKVLKLTEQRHAERSADLER